MVKLLISSLWLIDAIWRHRTGSTLAQVMACCLTAPSHHLHQCWLIISSAAAKQSPSRQMRPMKLSGDITKYWSDWQPKNFFCQNPCQIVPNDAAMLDVWLSKYAFLFHYFMSDHPKFVLTTQRTNWVVRWVTQDFSLAAALLSR